MKVKRHLYLKDKKCSHLSYYECCVNILKTSNFNNCSTKCIPASLKSIGKISLSEIPTCYPETEDVCTAWEYFYKIYNGICTLKCLKSCEIEEYTGKIDYLYQRPEELNRFIIVIRYSPPYKVSLTQEYLIYDFIGMVGSVGGTLGIFIGFSFYDVIVRITNLFR